MDGCAQTACSLTAPTVLDYAYLTARMRAQEVRHFLALSGLDRYDPDIAARAMAMQPGPAFCLHAPNGYPIAAAGFIPERRGVYEAWMLGNDEAWTYHWRTITRICRREMDRLFQQGAHRIHVITAPDHTKVREWYVRGLRMRFEGILTGYCADGSDMAMYARTR